MVLWDKDFDNKSWYTPLSLIQKTFRYRSFPKHRRVLQRNIWTLRDKKSRALRIDITFLCVKFFDTRFFSEKRKGSPTKFFCYCETKTWTISRDTPLCLLSKKLFDTRIFLKHRRVPPRKLWTLRGKMLIAQNDDIPFLCVRFFETLFFLKHRRVHLRKVSVRWDKTVCTENRDTRHSLIPNFFDTRIFLKHRRVFLRIFSVVRERKRSTKIVIIVPPPTYPQNFSTSIFFWNTESFPYDGFWYCETSTLRRTVVMSPISFILKIFSMLAVFRNIEGTIYKVFQHCEKKRFPTEFSDIPFLCKKCFDTRFFLKHRRFPLLSFSILWDINFSTDSCDVPCFF